MSTLELLRAVQDARLMIHKATRVSCPVSRLELLVDAEVILREALR